MKKNSAPWNELVMERQSFGRMVEISKLKQAVNMICLGWHMSVDWASRTSRLADRKCACDSLLRRWAKEEMYRSKPETLDVV